MRRLTHRGSRLVQASVLAAAAALALTGCADSSSTGGDAGAVTALAAPTGVKPAGGCPAPASITIWSNLESHAQQAMETAEAGAFAAACPGSKITYSYYKSTDLSQKLAAVMASGTPPTMFNTFGGSSLDRYAAAGKLVDVDKALAADDPSWKSKVIPASLDAGRYGTGVYGFPVTGPQLALVFYNKKVFKQVGITPPTTLAEYDADVQKIKKAGISPVAVGAADLWPTIVQFELNLARAAGTAPVKALAAQTKGAWSTPSVKAALELLREQGQNGTFEPAFNSVSVSDGSAAALLYTGRAAMEVCSPFLFDQIQSGDPSFVADGDLGYFAYPAGAGGAGSVGVAAGMYALTSSATQAQQKLAAAYLTSQILTADYAKRQGATGLIPALTGAEDVFPSDAAGQVTKFSYELGEKTDVIPQLDDVLPNGSTLDTLAANVMDSTATPSQLISTMNLTTK